MTVNRKTKILFPLIVAFGCLVVAASFNTGAAPMAATVNLNVNASK